MWVDGEGERVVESNSCWQEVFPVVFSEALSADPPVTKSAFCSTTTLKGLSALLMTDRSLSNVFPSATVFRSSSTPASAWAFGVFIPRGLGSVLRTSAQSYRCEKIWVKLPVQVHPKHLFSWTIWASILHMQNGYVMVEGYMTSVRTQTANAPELRIHQSSGLGRLSSGPDG